MFSLIIITKLIDNPVPSPKIAHNTRYFDFLIAVMPWVRPLGLISTVKKLKVFYIRTKNCSGMLHA